MPLKKIALILFALAAGWALFFYPLKVLRMDNTTRGEVSLVRLTPAEHFSVSYHHSLYEQAVREDFAADADNNIVLLAVRSNSGAVLQYFGFHDQMQHQPIEKNLGRIVFRVAAGEAQQLLLRDQVLSFLRFGDHGDRVVMSAADTSFAVYSIHLALHPPDEIPADTSSPSKSP